LDLLARVVVELLRLVHGSLSHGHIVVIGDQVPIQVQNVCNNIQELRSKRFLSGL